MKENDSRDDTHQNTYSDILGEIEKVVDRNIMRNHESNESGKKLLEGASIVPDDDDCRDDITHQTSDNSIYQRSDECGHVVSRVTFQNCHKIRMTYEGECHQKHEYQSKDVRFDEFFANETGSFSFPNSDISSSWSSYDDEVFSDYDDSDDDDDD